MLESINVIGRGRVGSAVSARLEERGVELREDGAELVLLCVPDTAIRDVARDLVPGPGWIAHVSGGTPLAALDPHDQRFGLHPLQTFSRARGPEQLDGAFAAVTAETEEARERGFELARLLGLKPFELADEARPLYHAGAAIAPNYLITLHRVASELFRATRAENDLVVPSLFVNPAQFAANEDLDTYPRDEQRDSKTAEEAGVDLLFAPETGELYPPGFQTWVEVEELGSRLEGEQRPGHFRGVATICLKLFNIVRPDRAYFGRKDAQQLAVIKQLVRDLDLELQIRAVETVRDADGLALSSRNARLSTDERERALAIPRALATRDPDQAREILTTAGIEPDYVTVADLDGPTLAVAARIGATRLIDNVLLER